MNRTQCQPGRRPLTTRSITCLRRGSFQKAIYTSNAFSESRVALKGSSRRITLRRESTSCRDRATANELDMDSSLGVGGCSTSGDELRSLDAVVAFLQVAGLWYSCELVTAENCA